MEIDKISIVILNYNAGELLEKCISSIMKSNYKKFEIILVDNNSKDNSHKKCKEKFPKIRLIENKENYGYCEGNNIGIRQITGEYCVILNPDTEVDPYWIDEFLDEYKIHGEGLYQPKLLTTSDKTIINSGGNMMNIFGFGYSIGKGQKDSEEFNKFKLINYASGACLFLAKKTLDKIGLFDPYLFAYHDDLELGWRAAQHKIQSFYVPNSIVYHSESFSFKWSSKKFYLLERNRWYCILTHYSKTTFYKILPSLIIIEIMITLFFLSKGMIKEKITASKDIIQDYNHIKKKHREIEEMKIVSDKEIIKTLSNKIEIPSQVTNSFSSRCFNKVILFLGNLAKKII